VASSGAGTLYFATTDGNVWCVKQSDGTGCSGWPAGGKVQVGASGTPIPLDYLYVGSSTDFKIHQLNPGTGADMKQYPASAALDGTATLGALSTETGTELFVGTSAGRVFKIPLSSGLP
jgi:outer membrane protein assembly factor BamB